MDTILRPNDLIKKLSISRATLYKLIKDGELEKPIQLGANSVGWKTSTIDQWLDDRAKQANEVA